MSSHQEPNPSFLFGDSTGDDPFSQLSQQQSAPQPQQTQQQALQHPVQASKTSDDKLGDASSLFGGQGTSNDFFTQPVAQPITADTNASSFFDQPSNSFFDTQPQATSLTQAYDPATYYSNTDQPVEGQWIEFDPNVHYYYDDQNQLHYYDPNTNQEYDMTGYEYQYDPQQYAEYYAQQGYDPSSYQQADTTQQQVYDNTQYDASQQQAFNYDPSGQQQEYDGQQGYFNQYDGYDQSNNNAVTQVSAPSEAINTQQTYQPDNNAYAPPTATAPPPTSTIATRPKYVGSAPPQQPPTQVFSPPPQATSTPPPIAPPPQEPVASAPPQQVLSPPLPQQQEDLLEKTLSPPPLQRVLSPAEAPAPTLEQDEAAILDDLDNLVLSSEPSHLEVEPQDFFSDQATTQQATEEPVHAEPVQQTTVDERQPFEEQISSYEPTYNQSENVQFSSYEGAGFEAAEDETVQFSVYEPQHQSSEEQHVQFASYQPEEDNVQFASYQPQEQQENVQFASYQPQGEEENVQFAAYEPQKEENVQFASYEPQQQQENFGYEPQQEENSVNFGAYEPQGDQTYGYEPQQEQINYGYEPQGEQANNYAAAYEPQEEQAIDYGTYKPQQPAKEAYDPHQPIEQNAFGSYEPQQPAEQITLDGYEPQQSQQATREASGYFGSYAPSAPAEPVTQAEQANVTSPKKNSYPPVQQAPPPVNSSYPPGQPNSVASPPQRMMSPFSQRNHSIDRQGAGSPFHNIERSATVPPPITERIASPRPQLIPCPDPRCEGENKSKAKFCCECGRPLAGISRSTTPAANMISTMQPMFTPLVVDPLQEQRDKAVQSLKLFALHSPLKHQDKQLAVQYIESRLAEFNQSKALAWNTVKLMIQYDHCTLGDGGELDQAIVDQLSPYHETSDSVLDTLEAKLRLGDRDGAVQHAIQEDMWAHALMISQNTASYNSVVSQFLTRNLFINQLKSQMAGDNKSLRFLYSVFSKLGSDAIFELARNKAEDHPTELTLGDDWKQALGLLLMNRSDNDQQVIYALGAQLKQLGSLDDASLCYILSLDMKQDDLLSCSDLDSLYLCELYELATKKSLNKHKLMHAWWLSDLGLTTDSQLYIDSINAEQPSNLEELKQLQSDTSLLNRTTLDTLIGSFESSGGNADTTNYGYGYGGGYTEAADEPVQSPFIQQNKGIQSPFGMASNNQGGVRSPFQHSSNYTPAPATNSWWGSEQQEDQTVPETTEQETMTSYQPDVYTPAATQSYDNDDDDLGFGNSKKKPAKEEPQEHVREEKPNEKEEEPTPAPSDKPAGGWGIFSLFGRKEKDPNAEEKKAVKANLGEQSSFYYDEKEKRWVNKLADTKPAAPSTPPPPRAAPSTMSPAPPAAVANLKPSASLPPSRASSTPLVSLSTAGAGPPNAAPPAFNTPPPSSRRGGSKKPMRSRYVDVLNTPN